MNENDLSDEAFWSCTDGMTRLQAWQECRRRAYEEIKQAHRTGYTEGTEMAEAGKEIELEKARREAISFAIGRVLYVDGIAPEIEVEEVYSAFLQEREKNDPTA